MNPRPITHGHLWLVFALPSFTSCKAGVSSRLQRAVSVAGIAPRFLQRSIRGSVSGRYPVIPLLGISVIYNVIDYCSQTQAVYDHLWNCSYPINELLHSFLDLFTGVKKYVVYY